MDKPEHNPDLHPQEAAQRQQVLLLRVVRISFIVLFFTVTVLTVLDIGASGEGQVGFGGVALAARWPVILGIAGMLGAVVISIDVFTQQKKIATLFSVFFGLLIAMLATVAMSSVVDLLATVYDINAPDLIATTKVLMGITLAYLSITTVLQTEDDFRLVIPYVEFAKQLRGQKPLVLDTSALIDARIVDVCSTGIIQAPIVIPSFVVDELQLLADSGDRLRRARGRRGLDVIARLQSEPLLDVSIDETPVQGKAVDQMLIQLAKSMPATIVTTDTGLSRVAGIQSLSVLNLNAVANALKPAVIPGETLQIKLIKVGEQAGQGVGYLEDGTMVVAEDGGDLVGTDVELRVTSSLQTSAGRLIFGKVNGSDDPELAAQAENESQSSDASTDQPALPRAGSLKQSPTVPEKRAGSRTSKTGRNPRR